jgi:hypothetical protein
MERRKTDRCSLWSRRLLSACDQAEKELGTTLENTTRRRLDAHETESPAGGRRHRRRVLRLLAGAALGAAVASVAPGAPAPAALAQAARPKLYVYLHTATKAAVFDKLVQDRLPKLEVTVFKRFGDFEQAMTESPPDAVLALRPLLDAQKLAPAVQAERAGKQTEPYVLLYVQPEMKTADLKGKTVAVLDLLGRDGTERLAGKVLGGAAGAKIKRVTKMEDLLSNLQLAAAHAVLVPARMLDIFQKRTELELHARELPGAELGLPAVAVLNAGAKAKIIEQVQQLAADINGVLGVDRWRAP